VLVKIGINGSGLLVRPDLDQVVEAAQDAEARGFSSFWLAQTGLVDAFTALAVLGRETSAIELGTAVVPTWTRHPEITAAGALTAQAASGGRIVAGIGLAHQPSVEDRWGMTWERPIKHMSEYLAILDDLLESGVSERDGEVWSLHREAALPTTTKPVVMLAALGRQMLDIAGRRADGTILWCVGPRTLEAQIVPTITSAAQGAGRPHPRIVCSLPVCVTDDPDPVRELVGGMLAPYAALPSYRAMLDIEGVQGVEDISLIGDEATVARGLGRIADAGATDFTAVVIGDRDTEVRTLDLLAASV
jgi:F420-dependent oxidoreductase-like protein